MAIEHDIMRQRLLERAGLIDKPEPKYTLRQLEKHQWSDKFELYMRNRLLMGGLRYGLMGEKGKPQYDSIASIRKRIELYEQTGNTEYLVDVANLCMVEFIEGKHPNKHFSATDDTRRVGVDIKHAQSKAI